MAHPVKSREIPSFDSIQELARFWDTHDITDFEHQLNEVSASVFKERTTIPVTLDSTEAAAVRKLAVGCGVPEAELIHTWVKEKIAAS
jgi:hypothetical protein